MTTTYQLGNFEGKLQSAKMVGDSEKPQLECVFEFNEGPNKGTTIRGYYYFTEKSQPITMRALELMGWDPNSDLDPTFPYHKNVELNIYTQDYEGQPQFRVRINDPERAGKPAMEVRTAKTFLGELSKAHRAMRGKSPATTAPVTPTQPGAESHGSDDDIPF